MSDRTVRWSSDRARPGWLVIARQETADLWSGLKGLTVLFVLATVLGLLSYLASIDAGINLLDARESVGIVVKTAVGLGTLAALVVSADSISGERERGTLEALLVTPIPRRAIVVGKLLGSTTLWVASLVIALPFVAVMAGGPALVWDALLVLLVVGALVAAALSALGVMVSALAMSNRVSLAASVTLLLALAAPAQLPAVQTSGVLGAVLITANPVSAGLALVDRVLVQQHGWADQWPLLVSPAVGAVACTVLAVGLSGRLHLGGAR